MKTKNPDPVAMRKSYTKQVPAMTFPDARATVLRTIRRRVRYRVTLGGVLFLIALSLTGAGAFLSGNNLLFLIFAAMLALLLVSGFLSRLVLSGLELELLLPEHVSARTPTPARVRIRNFKRLTPSFSIELSGIATTAPSILTRPVYFPLIPGRSTVESPIEVVFPRRGTHQDNLFLFSTRFPFGFLRKTTTVTLRRETLVYPSLGPRPAMEPILDSIAGRSDAQLRGASRDFYRIRPYESPDNARHVDWKSTAKTGSLQIREFARDQKPAVEIHLHPEIDPGQEGAFEDLVEECAFVGWRLAALETRIFFESGRFSVVIPDGGDVYDILKYLSLVEPVTVVPFSQDDPPMKFQPDEANMLIVFSARTGHQEV
jgi:uncharacterized protein (DUF58 family)